MTLGMIYGCKTSNKTPSEGEGVRREEWEMGELRSEARFENSMSSSLHWGRWSRSDKLNFKIISSYVKKEPLIPLGAPPVTSIEC